MTSPLVAMADPPIIVELLEPTIKFGPCNLDNHCLKRIVRRCVGWRPDIQVKAILAQVLIAVINSGKGTEILIT